MSSMKRLLRNQLNGKNNIWAINPYRLPAIWYSPGIIRWTKEEIEATDTKTRKLLTMHRGFHPKFSASALYPKWKEEGRNKDHPWAQNKHKIKKGLGLPSVAPGKRLCRDAPDTIQHICGDTCSCTEWEHHQEKGAQETPEVPRSEKRASADVEGEGKSDWSSWFIDPQAEWVAPAAPLDLRNNT